MARLPSWKRWWFLAAAALELPWACRWRDRGQTCRRVGCMRGLAEWAPAHLLHCCFLSQVLVASAHQPPPPDMFPCRSRCCCGTPTSAKTSTSCTATRGTSR